MIVMPPFHIVAMPLNKEGEGPEMEKEKVDREVWQIWDSVNQTISEHDRLFDAQTALQRLRGEFKFRGDYI